MNKTKKDYTLDIMRIGRGVVIALSIFATAFVGISKSVDNFTQRVARNYIESVNDYTLVDKHFQPFLLDFVFELEDADGKTISQSVSWTEYVSFRDGDTVSCVRAENGYIPLRGPGHEQNATWASSENAVSKSESLLAQLVLPLATQS